MYASISFINHGADSVLSLTESPLGMFCSFKPYTQAPKSPPKIPWAKFFTPFPTGPKG